MLPLLLVLLTASPAAKGLEQGQKLFNQGDFDGAMKVLDATVQAGAEAPVLSKLQLLRGQVFAARQDFSRAEEAFSRALEADSSAELDPARVDPTVVRLLESVRSRLTGTLVVESSPPGALVALDGVALGKAPLTKTVPAGRHTVEVRWGGATPQTSELQVKAKSETRLHVVGAESTAANDWVVGRPLRPFGDLRGSFEPQVSGAISGGLELGGGVELSWFRLGAYFRVYPYFWVTPRFQFAVPVHSNFNVLLEVAVPFRIGGYFNVGLSGAGGAEWYPFKFFGVYAMFGGQHFFVRDETSFIVTAGARLRLP